MIRSEAFNKKKLLALLNAFDINTLMLLDMEISQKICKLVPYTAAEDNREDYTSSSDSSDESSNEKDDGLRSRGTFSKRKPAYRSMGFMRKHHPKRHQSLFYNFAHRDQFKWKKFHTIKMIYHKPSRIMFVFCNKKNGDDIVKLMRKTYLFQPIE